MKKWEKLFYWVALFVAFITLTYLLIETLTNQSTWLDETFTLKLIEKSYLDVVKITAMDVHPPLYYLMLKFFLFIFRLPYTTVVLSKIFSLIPLYLLVMVSATYVRKRFGEISSALFTLSIISMNTILYYGIEIRMYSWAMFFVTTAYLFLYDIIQKNDYKSWIGFVFFSLCAAYTQYYALIAISLAYIFLFINCFITKKWKNWLIGSTITVIAYLPWLFILINQFEVVSGDYWIPPLNQATILSYFTYFLFISKNSIYNLIYLILIIIFVILATIKGYKDKKFLSWSLIGIFMPFYLIFIGTVVSLLIQPLFVERYIIVTLGVFYLGLSSLFGKNLPFKINIIPFIFFLTFGYIHNKSLISTEMKREKEANKAIEIFGHLWDEDVIITTNSEIQRNVSIFTNANSYVYGGGTSILSDVVYSSVHDFKDGSVISDTFEQGRYIYYISQTNNEMGEWLYNGFSYTLIGTITIDSYRIYVWEIVKQTN